MELFELIRKNLEFLENYHNFFKNNSITTPYYNRIRDFLSNNIFNLEYSKEYISDVKDIGVIHASDLLTYHYVSRLMYSVHDARKKVLTGLNGLKDELIDAFFNLINFLLLSNIFPPNDGIDTKDIGNGKYENEHKNLRFHLIKNLLPSILREYNDSEFQTFVKKCYTIAELITICPLLSGGTWDRIFNHPNFSKDEIITFLETQPYSYFNRRGLDTYCRNDAPSFLLKNVGLATELFVYLSLISMEYGYVIPLLLHQRLFSCLKNIFSGSITTSDIEEKNILVVTDFLLISKGRIYALELGRGKPDLISSFASVSGIPTIFIDAHLNLGPKFGYKCNLCYNSFTICKKYIKEFKLGNINPEPLCLDCEFSNTCKDKTYQFVWIDDRSVKGHIHKECYDLLSTTKKSKFEIDINVIYSTYAIVENLEKLKLGL